MASSRSRKLSKPSKPKLLGIHLDSVTTRKSFNFSPNSLSISSPTPLSPEDFIFNIEELSSIKSELEIFTAAFEIDFFTSSSDSSSTSVPRYNTASLRKSTVSYILKLSTFVDK